MADTYINRKPVPKGTNPKVDTEAECERELDRMLPQQPKPATHKGAKGK